MVEPAVTEDIQKKREYLLELTNIVRRKYNRKDVYLDEALNRLAQSHADDMSIFNYFSHTDKYGRDPGARAQNMGILSSIGENIANAATLTQAHLRLERSAAHLDNTISELWTRVGIGIARSYSGQYYVAYEFSSRDLSKEPLTQSELQAYQK